MFPLGKGEYSKQAHVALPEGTFEDEHGREGFYGRVSHLYHRHPPTGWTRIEGPLKPRAVNCLKLAAPEAIRPDDPFGEPVTFLYNADLALKIVRPTGPMPYYMRNADGDDVYFIHQGAGRLESDYGPLLYERGDYLVIPRGTTYRFTPADSANQFYLLIESFSEIKVPVKDRGMLGVGAQYDMGVVETPSPEPAPAGDLTGSQPGPQGEPEWEVRIKREGEYTSVFYPFNPLDVVGWKGDLCPIKLNIKDYRPVMSHRVHLPPSVHTTFLANNFVICSFVPRPFETDPEAMRVPFFHRNIDYDEVLFYHDGNFFSRHGIDAGMVTWHPQGIHHGPHPKAIGAVKNKVDTDEYAVMLDTRYPLKMTGEGQAAEWPEYHMSWSM
ncbi:MAG: Homogentisate 1,2-dioxygenase [Chloroflexi bacterium]|nr:Homogentisate 1,2-dioxygenase [Chloroflexota bacterium]